MKMGMGFEAWVALLCPIQILVLPPPDLGSHIQTYTSKLTPKVKFVFFEKSENWIQVRELCHDKRLFGHFDP